jgi:hypothetical protein
VSLGYFIRNLYANIRDFEDGSTTEQDRGRQNEKEGVCELGLLGRPLCVVASHDQLDEAFDGFACFFRSLGED